VNRLSDEEVDARYAIPMMDRNSPPAVKPNTSRNGSKRLRTPPFQSAEPGEEEMLSVASPAATAEDGSSGTPGDDDSWFIAQSNHDQLALLPFHNEYNISGEDHYGACDQEIISPIIPMQLPSLNDMRAQLRTQSPSPSKRLIL
jgi:hypothetical protein